MEQNKYGDIVAYGNENISMNYSIKWPAPLCSKFTFGYLTNYSECATFSPNVNAKWFGQKIKMVKQRRRGWAVRVTSYQYLNKKGKLVRVDAYRRRKPSNNNDNK